MTTPTHHPKGSMCVNCERANDDCSGFGFNRMMVFSQYSPANDLAVFKVVRCGVFKRNAVEEERIDDEVRPKKRG